ncbi:MAG: YfiR family protein [Bacteroidales bacterium]|nr:YfiR family protein [Bacteroidales bacterium]
MRRILILFGLLILWNPGIFSQTELGKAQAFFIYNFSRLIKWPANYSQGDFVIGVFGNSNTYENLVELTKNKKVGMQTMVVRKFSDVGELPDCHILLIAADNASKINEINQRLANKHTLIISESNGLINQGSAIDFLVVDSKLKFKMNVGNAEKYNLIVSKSLLDMAMVN